jgi:hypothetical protein
MVKIRLDAGLDNADWPKRTWDYPLTVSQIDDMTEVELRQLAGLPAYQAAPPAVRRAVEARLAGSS